MTPEEHQAEHIRLHRALDELLACYLSQKRKPLTSINDPIIELLRWSHQMTLAPSLCPEDPRGAA